MAILGSNRDWKRIARTVRRVEAMPQGSPKRRNNRGARGAAPSVHLVKVKWSGNGDGGGLSAPPSFRYDVWLSGGDTSNPADRILLNAPIPDTYRGQQTGLALVAPDDSEGLATRDANGWRLLVVFGEQWDTGPCSGAQ